MTLILSFFTFTYNLYTILSQQKIRFSLFESKFKFRSTIYIYIYIIIKLNCQGTYKNWFHLQRMSNFYLEYFWLNLVMEGPQFIETIYRLCLHLTIAYCISTVKYKIKNYKNYKNINLIVRLPNLFINIYIAASQLVTVPVKQTKLT